MSAPVIKLAPRPPVENKAELLDKLRWLTRMAKKGEITSLAYAATRPGNWVGEGWTSAENTVLLLGAVAILQQRMAQRLADNGEET